MTTQAATRELDDMDKELNALLGGNPEGEMFEEETAEIIAAELEVDDLLDEEGVIEGEVLAAGSDDLEEMVAAVEMEEVRHKVHAAQETDGTVADLKEIVAPAKAAKPAARRMTTAGMKPSEILRAKLGERMNEFLVLELSDADLGAAALQAKIKGYLSEFDKLPKKVGEKVVNLITHLADGVNLSNYTVITLKLLATGETTTADIRKAYLDRPYSAGTANAQSSQMTALLPVLRIAKRNGPKMTLNPDSSLAAMLTPAK